MSDFREVRHFHLFCGLGADAEATNALLERLVTEALTEPEPESAA